ncbi:sodium:proton exchanger [candidate division WWE3 bacterium]|nr:sodium:proton exchanger [candidate division WWE3 bacterium]
MKFFKQPLVIGYIITGLVLAPFLLAYPESAHTVETFSELGIAILLFIVGLHLSPKELKSFGKAAFKIGLAQILFTFVLGFIFSRLLGYVFLPALYLAIALTFSSTIIVLKVLADKKELEKLYGRIAIGILLLQDLVAALVLIFISASGGEGVGLASFVRPFVLGGLTIVVMTFLMIKVLPRLFDFFAKTKELLFLFSLAWGFGLATVFHYFGLSIEIGALAAGVILSISPYSVEISNRLKPLKDFFVIMFFILMGSRVDLGVFTSLWLPGLTLTLFIVIVKPLIIMSMMGFVGRYKKKPSFMGAVSLAQISEFSLIVALLGFEVGHIDHQVLSLITMLAVVSIGISTYGMMFSEKLYVALSKHLNIFQRRRPVKTTDLFSNYEVILFGGERVGYDFIEVFKDLGQSFLCIDFDPDLVKELVASGINCKYGDAEDAEFLEEINISDAKMVVSTISDNDVNDFLFSQIKNPNEVIIVLLATSVSNALHLYERGADYVILPHFLGGHFVAELAEKVGFDDERFNEEKRKHIIYLEQRRSLGHS